MSILTFWQKKLSLSLLVLARRVCGFLPSGKQAEETVRWVGGATCNLGAGEAGVVDVQEGEMKDTNDFPSCSQCVLQGPAAGNGAGTTPQDDAAAQDALNGASVEVVINGARGSRSSQFSLKVELLLGFFGQRCGVDGQGQVLADGYTQELSLPTRSTVAPLMVSGGCWACSVLE